MSLALPKQVTTENGEERHVGFEFEYSGISLDDSVNIVNELVTGEVNKLNAFHYEIEHDEFGVFSIELDAALLKEEKYKHFLSDMGVELEKLDKEQKLDNLLKELAETVVPVEIVTPPLPMSNMDIVDRITHALRKGQAKGSNASIIYAFGLHMNAEAVSQQADYLLNHVRAFALLYDWIVEDSNVDFSRQISRYIKEYPEDYLELILEKDYQPGVDTLIDDYLRLVASRNFALDMLPCFADIDKDKTLAKAKEPKLIKPRPAFHYRLANCLIDEEDWSVAKEWAYWVAIEQLANDEDKLYTLMEQYWGMRRGSLLASRGKWIQHVADFIA